jgi:hypothetical protein
MNNDYSLLIWALAVEIIGAALISDKHPLLGVALAVQAATFAVTCYIRRYY